MTVTPQPTTAAPAQASRRGASRGVLALGVLVLVGAWSVAPAVAAPPSPSPGTSGSLADVQAWLDSDFIVPDAPPGGVLTAGITFWNTATQDFAPLDGVYARLRPRAGTAAPSDGTITADFPGHIVADLVVPEGGPGSIEVGVRGADGEVPFELAGTGPPPGAALASLVTASFHRFVGDIVISRTFPVSVDLLPRGQWNVDDLPLGTDLTLSARHPGGPELTTADLVRAPNAPDLTYSGRLTLSETGDVELTVLVPGSGGSDLEIAGSTTTVTVIVGGRPSASPAGPAPTSPAAAAGIDVPPIVWLAGVGVLVVAGFFVLRRALADL